MSVEERRTEILKIISKKKHVSVDTLSSLFSVSPVTIRKDLNALETQGLIKRNHGGAFVRVPLEEVPDIVHRRNLASEIKVRIGQKAVELIEESDVVMIDASTTAYEVARNFDCFMNLTVITNSLDICNLLVNYDGVTVILSGGELIKSNLSLRSYFTSDFFKNYHANVAVLGVTAYCPQHGFTTQSDLAAYIKRQMIKSSQQVIAVCDSSKFNKVAFASVCQTEDVDVVITDEGIPDEVREALESKNVKVIIV